MTIHNSTSKIIEMVQSRLNASLGKYPRLVRVSFVLAFAMSFNQLAKTPKLVQAHRKIDTNDITSIFNLSEEHPTHEKSLVRDLED